MLSSEELDAPAVDRIVDHMIDGGVTGLFLLGTTGEGPSLMYQMRYEMVEQVCRKNDGRVHVLVCVTDTSMGEAIAQHRIISMPVRRSCANGSGKWQIDHLCR
jgi:4-hydroxy-tetrahydrodipicolinate synthase